MPFVALFMAAERRFISAVSVMEACFVLAGRDGDRDQWRSTDDFIRDAEVQVMPFDERAALLARDAFLRYGKGRHPAALNMGDCASYALAKSRDLPLLFKGNDFSQTDIRVAA